MTEKSYKQVEADKKYHFKVHKDANKNDVKLALSKLYSVTPLSINLVAVPYKGRANRKLVRRAYKKAIVTLQE
jgi:ribosomal protein L23